VRQPAAALGFAPHSGWAVAVGVVARDGRLEVVLRERIEMVDARAPASKQPYHAVEGQPIAEAADRLSRWQAAAQAMASRALDGICGRTESAGCSVRRLGILDAAGRRGASLAATLASHALIHTADGEHFRTAIAAAAAARGLPHVRVRARELPSRAAAATGRSPEAMEAELKSAARHLGPPWAADQKAAALLAWLVLAEAP
jgi:hypothetical protein